MTRITTLLSLAALFALIPLVLPAQASHPILVFSTFLGGSGVENLRDVTSDNAGNV